MSLRVNIVLVGKCAVLVTLSFPTTMYSPAKECPTLQGPQFNSSGCLTKDHRILRLLMIGQSKCMHTRINLLQQVERAPKVVIRCVKALRCLANVDTMWLRFYPALPTHLYLSKF